MAHPFTAMVCSPRSTAGVNPDVAADRHGKMRWRSTWARLGSAIQSAVQQATAPRINKAGGDRRLFFEPLEPRLLLSADPFTYTLSAEHGDVLLRLLENENETLVQLVDNATENAPVLKEQNLVDTSSIQITGSALDDRLSIDVSLFTVTNSLVVTFDGGGANDTLVGPDADAAIEYDGTTWRFIDANAVFSGALEFSNVENVEAGAADDMLSGTASAETWTVSAANTVALDGIQFSGINSLSGGTDDTLDYSSYTQGVTVDLGKDIGSGFLSVAGFANLVGSAFDDSLTGDDAANIIAGGAGDDAISGGLGVDDLDGGDDTDTLVERQDADLTLTNISLYNGTETDILAGFEAASLTGGANPNTLDTSAFTLGGVTLSGATDVYLTELNSGSGVGIDDVDSLVLTGATSLALLNNGDGVSVVGGDDLNVLLTDGSSVAVNLSGASTLQDVIDAIEAASARLVATITTSGSGLQLRDTVDDGGDLEVQALNGSNAAADLGILGPGSGLVILGTPINDVSGDLRVTLTDGTEVDIDLTGSETLQQVLDAITGAHDRLSATIDAAGKGIALADAVDDGVNALAVSALNGSSAAADLGLSSGTASNNLLAGSDIAGSIYLDLRNDADTLIGSDQDDFLTGGAAADSITGGMGTDTLVETRDADITLTDTALSFDGSAEDSLSGINAAWLTGGASANTIDASAFTLGGVTLDGAAGDDTLTGTDQDDFFTGGPGQDTVYGLLGTDTLIESGNHRFDLDDTSLDTGEGTDEVQTVSLSGTPTGGNFTLSYNGEQSAALAFDANAEEMLRVLWQFDGIGEDDIEVSKSGNTWTLTFVNNLAGTDVAALAVGTDLVDGATLVVGTTTSGSSLSDTLSSIEKAELTGGEGRNRIDASGFSGDVVLDGVNNANILLGGSGDDDIFGGDGNDLISGGLGDDNIDGRGAFDILDETRDADITLTNFAFSTSAGESDSLTGIEAAFLTGGAGANTIDASGFTGLSTGTYLSELNNSAGVDRALSEQLADLTITLADGSDVDVSLGLALTVQDVLDAISAASEDLSASLDATGSAIEIVDSSTGGGTFAIAAANSSGAINDLGLDTLSSSAGTHTGAAIPAGYVVIDGGADADTLIGTIGDDLFTGGSGGDSITGGEGIDTIVEIRDADMTLEDKNGGPANDAELTIGSEGTDTLVGIERARLIGGVSVNNLDASGFTLGPVVLGTGATSAANAAANGDVADVLKGTDNDDYFLVNVSALSGSQVVQIDPGLGDDEVIVEGVVGSVSSSDLDWVEWVNVAPGQMATKTYALRSQSLTVNSNLDNNNPTSLPTKLRFDAHTLNINADISNVDVINDVGGDIQLHGTFVNIKSGVQILADTVSGLSNPGNIEIQAIDDVARFGVIGAAFSLEDSDDTSVNGTGVLGYGNVDYVETGITIDGVLRGGKVEILAETDTVHYFEDSDFGNSPVNEYVNTGISGVFGFIENLSVFAGVAVTTAKSHVNINSGAEIYADTLNIDARARANVYTAPISPGVGVAVGVGKSEAILTIDGTIVTTGNAVFGSKVGNRIDVVADATEVATGAAAVAVSVVNSTSEVNVTDNANLTIGGSLILSAETVDTNRTMARSTAGDDGAVGLAVAVSVENGSSNAYLDGNAEVAGNVTVSASHSKSPLLRNKVLVIPSMVNGVQAIAGVGTESKGDLLDDAQAKGVDLFVGKYIDKVSKWFANKWAETFGSSDEVWDFDIAAAFNVVVDNNSSIARIGDDLGHRLGSRQKG